MSYGHCPRCGCKGDLDGHCEIEFGNTPITYSETWACMTTNSEGVVTGGCGHAWTEHFQYTGQDEADDESVQRAKELYDGRGHQARQ